MKVHILRPDSVTPIARYLDRREQNGDSFAVQLEFATVLLYREREYRDAAVMASTGPNSIGESEQIADKATARAKRLTKEDLRPLTWSRRTMDAFEERIRRSAIRARTRVEGKAFTRFLSTELAFCERERKTALKTFDAARVPRQLRHLVPLARVLGIGDDSCRALFIQRMPRSERRAAAKRIRDAADAIGAWLKQLKEPYHGEAAAFFWLQEAAEEIT